MASPTVWDEDYKAFVHAAHIADPTGGTTIDSEARTAIVSALAALRAGWVIGRDSTSTVQAQVQGATVYDATRRCYVAATAISDPSGGATIDTNLRTAVGQILTAMRGGGIIAGGSGSPSVWDEDTDSYAFSAYTTPSGGATVDAEGRTAADAIAVALRSAGLLTLD